MQYISLMYHDVCNNNADSGFCSKGADFYKITPEVFRSQISYLKKYCVENRILTNRVFLSFDDGGESNYDVIAPILEEYDFRGIFCIATDFIDKQGFMTVGQILDLESRGHIIASHSSSHPSMLSSLSTQQRYREWKGSLDILSKIIGKDVSVISVPNGYVSYEDAAFLSDLRVKLVLTSKINESTELSNVHFLGRVAITSAVQYREFVKIISKPSYISYLRLKTTILSWFKKLMGPFYIKLKTRIRNYNK